MSLRCAAVFLLLVVPYALGDVVEYEGDVFPEDAGFERAGSFTAERELIDGWFIQQIEGWYEPPVMNGGDSDYYRWVLSQYQGAPFYAEWRVFSDAPPGEVDHHNGAALLVIVGGPVTYHFNMANGLVRLIRGVQYPGLYFNIEPDVPHTYRLEVYGGDWFEFQIDGEVLAAGVPEDVFPTSDALMSFGARYHLSGHTTQWDFVRFGTIHVDPIPTVSAWGVVLMTLLVLTAGTLVFGRHRQTSLTSAVT